MRMADDERHHGIDAKVVAALDVIGDALHVLARRTAETHGLSSTQLRILAYLHHGPPPRAQSTALARELNVADPTVSDAVGALHRKGLVERRRDPDDGRQQQIVLTLAGRRIAAKAARRMVPAEIALSSIDPTQAEDLFIALLAVLQRFHEADLIPVSRSCTTCDHLTVAPGTRSARTHRCAYFDHDLPPSALRVDCAQHRTKGSLTAVS
ncbi:MULTISPECIES: MarR family winged helix-turn-helix transcriptional regulator [Protofrankia]|uniref:MarR family winged helix-turn-helix transcriptional regulator n=1 Tax=Protofrankia TaxID=2994361 RepID=UPI0009F9A7C8|nr:MULTISPECIES: helix-turn-helix domain-containing protein [Protofrankia]